MHTLLKIDCIMYLVKDLEIAAKFYEKVIGLKRRWKDEEKQMIGFTFQDSNSELVLHSDPSIPNYEFCYSVENVQAFCKEYKEKGYTVKLEPIDVRCGQYAILLDPDENIIPIIDLTKFDGKPHYDE